MLLFIIFVLQNNKMASQTEENYLKALFSLSNDKGEVNISELSINLDVSKPTANSMVKNLKNQGFVIYERYKPLKLTPSGKKAAALIIRKHRLTEMFLVEKMGFGWELVHEIAEQVEHINSDPFFYRMDEMMGCPKVDPHGSPIPDKEGKIEELDNQPLSVYDVGDKVVISGLSQSSASFLEFLNTRELQLGSEITVLSKETYDGSMTVSYSNHSSEVLSDKVCEKLLVTAKL